MGKSSSSLKKKRSKAPSKSRARKRNKIKGRKNKSDKVRRRDDSVSYSDDIDSASLGSLSSSSSEEYYRNRRSRSRTRKNGKGSRKRARRRSLSVETNEESSHARSKKRSRRDNDYETSKRALRKKKRASVNSTTSGSRSCSTCSSGSSDSHDSEFDRRRYKSERKEKRRRRMEKIKSTSKSSRKRSTSCSPCSQYSEGDDYQMEERVMEANNSRRLRSVITVLRETNEGRESDRSEHKDEIVYEHDDYPSCRSNDSNDGGCWRDLPEHSHFTSRKNVDEQEGEKCDISNFRGSVVIGSDQNDNPSCDGVGENDAANERKTEACGFKSEDLETILRQRALENLIKFRGRLQTNMDSDHNNQHGASYGVTNMLPTPEAELVQSKSVKGLVAKVASASQASQQNRLPAVTRESLIINNGGKESGSAVCGVSSSLTQVAYADNPKEKVRGAINYNWNKPKLVTSVWRRESSDTCITSKPVSAPQESCQTNLVIGSCVDKSVVEPAQAGNLQSGKDNGKLVMNDHGSASGEPIACCKSTSEDISVDKQQVETKEGTQFEEKTMSVMRGGEMVQVGNFCDSFKAEDDNHLRQEEMHLLVNDKKPCKA